MPAPVDCLGDNIVVGIGRAVAGRAVADFKISGVGAGAIDQMMSVSLAGHETRAHARGQQLLAAIGHQYQFTADDVNEFVLLQVPVAQRGRTPRFDRGQIDAEVFQPERIAQPLLEAARYRRLEWRGIVGTLRRGYRRGIERG